MRKRILGALLAATLLPGSGMAQRSGEVIEVYAAASLRDVLADIKKKKEASNRLRVELSFGGSQDLAQRFLLGSRHGTVFISADERQMKRVVDAKIFRPDHVRAIATNTGSVVVSRRARGRIRKLRDLSKPGLLLAIAGKEVPAGRVALEMIHRASATYGRSWERRVLANVVTRETDVRAVLAKVRLGEADAGFVYVTDALSAKGKVIALEVPSQFRASTTYLAASGNGSRSSGYVFVSTLARPNLQAFFRRYGFGPPP
ncbi:MAG: molybdate ABC transporter substrate-binding protein, partial [Fimbriimonas ginsengisoli]|nr:molybdate ABC transporter substrate-binding protein [Fimbriimonas ginsengisoli]